MVRLTQKAPRQAGADGDGSTARDKLAYMDKQDGQDERVKFLAKLPPTLHRWLKVTAAQRGQDINDLIVAALDSDCMRVRVFILPGRETAADAWPKVRSVVRIETTAEIGDVKAFW